MPNVLLDIRDDPPGIGLERAPLEVLDGQAELHDEIAGEVRDLAKKAGVTANT